MQDAQRIRDAQAGDPLKLVWLALEHPTLKAKGVQSAYAVDLYGIGHVQADGSWTWNGRDGTDREQGLEESVLAAKFEIQQRWDRMIEKHRDRKPMTQKQIEAAYRSRLVGRINSSGPENHYGAITAIDTLIRNGWIDKCPIIDTAWIGYMPPMMIFELKKAGKLPSFEDVL